MGQPDLHEKPGPALAHQTAELFFARVVMLAREHGWASDAHFTVDGTLIDAWASLKSFQPKAGPQAPDDGDPGNPGVDFHGQKRSNLTHQSATDAEAQLARKGRGKEARLCFGLHALMENRYGLCVQALITTAHGVTVSTAATGLLARQLDLAERPPESLGADKGYHTAEVVGFCRAHGIKPHAARIKGRKVPGLDGRTTRSLGHQTAAGPLHPGHRTGRLEPPRTRRPGPKRRVVRPRPGTQPWLWA